MKRTDFLLAIEILSANHSTKITINQPIDNFVGELGESKYTIHITNCIPSVTNNLIKAGFSLRMTEKYGLEVCKF